MLNTPGKVNTILKEEQLKELGFEKLQGDMYCRIFEHCDCPQAKMAEVREAHPDKDLIFHMDSMHVFQQDYSIYGRDKEEE